MSKKDVQCAAPSSAIYGLGFVGAVIYYIVNASGVGAAIFGIVKAIVWPAILVYELMSYLNL